MIGVCIKTAKQTDVSLRLVWYSYHNHACMPGSLSVADPHVRKTSLAQRCSELLLTHQRLASPTARQPVQSPVRSCTMCVCMYVCPLALCFGVHGWDVG